MSVFNYPQCRVSLIAYSNTHSRIKLKTSVHMKVVSERLGHAHIALTMQTYQHLLPGMQEDAANTVERLTRPKRQKTTDNARERRGNTRRKSA